MQLREYQLSGIEKTRELFAGGARRVLIVLPTGGGKTVLASEIIRRAAVYGTRTLFLAHRRELVQQTSDKLNVFGVNHGIIQAGTAADYDAMVQVASVQTLVRRFDRTHDFGLVFIDEAHHASATSYKAVLSAYPSAKVIGLTATPWRLDGKGLADIFDSHVIVSTPIELQSLGFLCPVRAYQYEAVSTEGVSVVGGDFNTAQLAEKAKIIIGDVVREFAEKSEGGKGILFACNVSHSEEMAAAFCGAGIQAEHVDGAMGHVERKAIFARLRNGATRVLTNCNIATEGFDLPELRIAMLCRPTLSESLALQMIGRVLRPSPGKSEARIHDHAGIIENFGHPYDADRDFSPTRTVNKKKGEFKRQKKAELGAERKPLTIEQVMQARAIEIEAVRAEEEARKKKEDDSPEGRRRRFQKIYWNETARFNQLLKLSRKHGSVEKGARAIRWQSGESYLPSVETMRAVREAMALESLQF